MIDLRSFSEIATLGEALTVAPGLLDGEQVVTQPFCAEEMDTGWYVVHSPLGMRGAFVMLFWDGETFTDVNDEALSLDDVLEDHNADIWMKVPEFVSEEFE